MAADYIDEPSCAQKGTGWISFDTKPKTKRVVKVKRKIIKVKKSFYN